MPKELNADSVASTVARELNGNRSESIDWLVGPAPASPMATPTRVMAS